MKIVAIVSYAKKLDDAVIKRENFSIIKISLKQQVPEIYNSKNKKEKDDAQMKNHKFWAGALVVCLIMTFYTGYKHK